MEHGFYSHEAYFYEEVLRVPLVVGFLGKGSGYTRIKGPRSLIDVPPTISSLLGEPSPNYRGRSVLSSFGYPVFAETLHNEIGEPVIIDGKELRFTFAIRKGDKKYIAQYKWPSLLWEELFDLKRDPAELRDLSKDNSYGDVLEELRGEISSHMRGIGFDPKRTLYRFKLMKLKRAVARGSSAR